MPLPKPRGGKNPESKKSFIERCAGDQTANKEFPDQKQKLAYCYSAWERRKARASYIIASGDDEILYTIARVMLPANLVEKMKTLPESEKGLHKVRAKFKNGKIRSGIVSNCEELEFDEDDEYENEEVEDVEMEDTTDSGMIYAAKNEGKTLNKPFRLPRPHKSLRP